MSAGRDAGGRGGWLRRGEWEREGVSSSSSEHHITYRQFNLFTVVRVLRSQDVLVGV